LYQVFLFGFPNPSNCKEDLLTAKEIAESFGFTSQLFMINLDGTWEEITG
jgi:hypothetical protein